MVVSENAGVVEAICSAPDDLRLPLKSRSLATMLNAELTQTVIALPAEDRLELARLLVESVAGPLTSAVAEGIRRIEDVATGRTPGLTEEQLRAF